MTTLIGARIKALREDRKLSQDDLARIFGFKDRQTVSAIENGERRLSAEELLVAVEKLGASLDYFTNPFLPGRRRQVLVAPIERGDGAARCLRAHCRTLDRCQPHAGSRSGDPRPICGGTQAHIEKQL